MNFILKTILMLITSTYMFAVACPAPETNATGSLRLVNSICPDLYTPPSPTDILKLERAIVYYYNNGHSQARQYSDSKPISITIDGGTTYRQPWSGTLGNTLVELSKKINAGSKFRATPSGNILTLVARNHGYILDTTAMSTELNNNHNNNSDYANIEYINIGLNATLEVFEINLSDINTSVIDVRIYFDNQLINVPSDINYSSGNASTINYEINNSIIITSDSIIKSAVISNGNTTLRLTARYTGSKTIASVYLTVNDRDVNNGNVNLKDFNTVTPEDPITIITKGVTGGVEKINIVYHGHLSYGDGNYSLSFGSDTNTKGFHAETPYKTGNALAVENGLYATLRYLARQIDANGTYKALVTGNILSLTEIVPVGNGLGGNDALKLEFHKNILAKSGNGKAIVRTLQQGMAVPEKATMTDLFYGDEYLYATYDVDYKDINKSDLNYSSADQDILEVLKIQHIATSSVSNSINFTPFSKQRFNGDITSVTASNNIIFVGEKNTSYYMRNIQSIKGLIYKKVSDIKVLGTNTIALNGLNVASNHSEYYFDSLRRTGYIFLADDTRLRIYKIPPNGLVSYYKTYTNFGGKISDIHRDGQSLYVQSYVGKRLTKFDILNENDNFSIEKIKDFQLEADKIYIDGKIVYYTDINNKSQVADINISRDAQNIDTSTIGTRSSNSAFTTEVSFIAGDMFYSASIGTNGLKIYDHNQTLIAEDSNYSGSKVLLLGEYIITDDNDSNRIRIYKFGNVAISNTQGEGSPGKPLNVKFSADKMNIKKITWSIRKNGEPLIRTRKLEQKDPTYYFTSSGLWYVEANIQYKNYFYKGSDRPYNFKYKYEVNVKEDRVPNISISSSSNGGLLGISIDFNASIAKSNYVDRVKWFFSDDNSTHHAKKASHQFNKEGNEFNATFYAYYDGGKFVTKTIKIRISKQIEMNITSAENNGSTTTYIKGSDLNFSVGTQGSTALTKFIVDPNTGVGISSPVGIRGYKWYFGDKKNSISYMEKPVFSYDKAGVYNIKTEITRLSDDAVFVSKKTISVVDYEEPHITASSITGEIPLKVQFGLSLKDFALNNVRPTAVKWIFPGSKYSSIVNPSYTFETLGSGSYMIWADINLSDGSTKRLERNITLSNTVSLALNATTIIGYAPLKVNVRAIAEATSGINKIEWIMNNEVINVGSIFSKTFDVNKTLNIRVEATSNKNHKSSTKNLVVTVYQKPAIYIEKVISGSKADLQFNLKGSSSDLGQITNYQWFVNNQDQFKTLNTFSKVFTESKEYTIKMIATLINGDKIPYYFNNGKGFNPFIQEVSLNNGWNLISSPVDADFKTLTSDEAPRVNVLNINLIKDVAETIYVYNNVAKSYIKNPTEILKRSGIWVKTNKEKVIRFVGDAPYIPTLGDYSQGWNLIGTGKDLISYHTTQSSVISATWVYQNGLWRKNPNIIKSAQGFWVKKK